MVNNIFMGGGGKYSTNEQIIGEQIDGKPIYRKVVQITSPTSDASFDMGLNNVDFIIGLYGCMINSNNDATIFNPTYSNSFTIYYKYDTNKLNQYYITSSPQAHNRTTYITIEYTKTTD